MERMDYLAASDVILDTVRFADGTDSGVNPGGQVVFAYTGLRLWTDSCRMICNVGSDFFSYFQPWIDRNQVPTDGIRIKSDFTNHFVLTYHENGSYEHSYGVDNSQWGAINFGYLRIDPEQIAAFCPGIKGLYVEHTADKVFWQKIIQLKKTYGFKIMWEVQRENYHADVKKYLWEIVPQLDMFSLNSREGCEFFGVQTDEEVIEVLKTFPTPCFFRVGEKGAHLILNGEDFFVPSVVIDQVKDPTGCGNSSTATALYAFCEGYSPKEIVLMANITAAYNLRQYGAIPDFSVREEAWALFEKKRREI